MIIDKQFSKNHKNVTYNFDVWAKAEQHFSAVARVFGDGMSVNIKICGDYYLMSSVWQKNAVRYTGIHAKTPVGEVDRFSGVNLTDDEWGMLVNNFKYVKDMMNGHDVDLSVCKAPILPDDPIRMYSGRWYVENQVVDYDEDVLLYFSEEEASTMALRRKPFPGKDYPSTGPEPELRVEELIREAPDAICIMNLVLVHLLERKISQESKEHCEGCQTHSDSGFEHELIGSCGDPDTDHIGLYYEKAKSDVETYDMIRLFEETRRRIRARLLYCKQLAKCARVWLSDEHLIEQLHIFKQHNTGPMSPLMNVIRDAARDIFDL